MTSFVAKLDKCNWNSSDDVTSTFNLNLVQFSVKINDITQRHI